MELRALTLAVTTVVVLGEKPSGLRGARMPANECEFPEDAKPAIPYYWDPECSKGLLGCHADATNVQCRFCGEPPYENVTCPEDAKASPFQACWFKNQPSHMFGYYWEPNCSNGMKGCLADGKHVQCRWCGEDGSPKPYSDIKCPENHNQCTFPNTPTTPYYWDAGCRMGMLGCNADGVHTECRFCGKFPFQDLPCRGQAAPSPGQCYFPVKPNQTYYWDEMCQLGMVGCWADSYHSQCRFCGGTGKYASVPCPDDL